MKEKLTTKETKYPYRPVIMPNDKRGHYFGDVIVSAIIYEAGYFHLFDGRYSNLQWCFDAEKNILIKSTSTDGLAGDRTDRIDFNIADELSNKIIANIEIEDVILT